MAARTPRRYLYVALVISSVGACSQITTGSSATPEEQANSSTFKQEAEINVRGYTPPK
jgi:hypothetical protein